MTDLERVLRERYGTEADWRREADLPDTPEIVAQHRVDLAADDAFLQRKRTLDRKVDATMREMYGEA